MNSSVTSLNARVAATLDQLQQADLVTRKLLAEAGDTSVTTVGAWLSGERGMDLAHYVGIVAGKNVPAEARLMLAQTVHQGTPIAPELTDAADLRADFNADGREDKRDALCGAIEISRKIAEALQRIDRAADGRTYHAAAGAALATQMSEIGVDIERLRHLFNLLTSTPATHGLRAAR